MPGCLIYTCAYNAEKTLPRTVKSILAQTYRDFTWYILDNGSTDKTGDYIKSLAKKESRIKYLNNKKNHVWEKGNSAIEVVRNNASFDYFCWIDSDDALENTIIEELTQFSEKKNCDVVCCSCKAVRAIDEKILKISAPHFSGIINSKAAFETNFPYYHSSCRTYWGKIFKMPVLLKTKTEQLPKLYYGWDTMFCLEALINAQSLGALNEPLYRYYISNKSSSYHYDSSRIDSDRFLFENALSYLNRKCGRVSPVNLLFLLVVYLNALNDTYNVLINSDLKVPEKIKELHRMTVSEYTNLFISNKFTSGEDILKKFEELKISVFTKIASWLLTCSEVPDELVEDFVETGEVAFTVIKNTEGWVYFEKLRIRFLIMQNRIKEAKEKFTALNILLPNDKEMQEFKKELF